MVFDHVDFGYTEDKTVLHDIEIFARPGQKVAFVGATGAGKTTITNLVNRFYDIQDGSYAYVCFHGRHPDQYPDLRMCFRDSLPHDIQGWWLPE